MYETKPHHNQFELRYFRKLQNRTKKYQEICFKKQFYFMSQFWHLSELYSTMYLCTRIYSNEFKFVYILPFSVVKYAGK